MGQCTGRAFDCECVASQGLNTRGHGACSVHCGSAWQMAPVTLSSLATARTVIARVHTLPKGPSNVGQSCLIFTVLARCSHAIEINNKRIKPTKEPHPINTLQSTLTCQTNNKQVANLVVSSIIAEASQCSCPTVASDALARAAFNNAGRLGVYYLEF